MQRQISNGFAAANDRHRRGCGARGEHAKGGVFRKNLQPVAARVNAIATSGLTEEEQDQLIAILRKMRTEIGKAI